MNRELEVHRRFSANITSRCFLWSFFYPSRMFYYFFFFTFFLPSRRFYHNRFFQLFFPPFLISDLFQDRSSFLFLSFILSLLSSLLPLSPWHSSVFLSISRSPWVLLSVWHSFSSSFVLSCLDVTFPHRSPFASLTILFLILSLFLLFLSSSLSSSLLLFHEFFFPRLSLSVLFSFSLPPEQTRPLIMGRSFGSEVDAYVYMNFRT